ncbi:MAG TPA: PAS domain S-box protein [Longimicrobiaceae bacterium]|nr:PAS domain S-box protein [Longimicrobiaceae bacterium]
MFPGLEPRRSPTEYAAASERSFRAIIENSSDVIAVLSSGGVIRYGSPSVAEALGYTGAELVGRSAWSLVHPEDAAEAIERFTRATVVGDCGESVLIRLLTRDGTWGTFAVRLSNLLDDPTVRGMVVTVRDLTGRKEAEENESRMTAILTASPDIVATLDPNGRALFLNPAGQALFGVPPEAVASVNVPDFYTHAESTRLLREILPTAMREGLWSGPSALLAADGGEVPVDQVVLAHRSAAGETEFFTIIAKDVSDWKRAEAELRSREQHFRALIENALDLVHLMDEEGRITYMSPAVERLLGYAPEEMVGRLAWELVHPEDHVKLREVLAERLAGVEGGPTLARVRHRDGRWRIFEIRANNLLSHPAVGGVVVNSRDITEQKAAEQKLAESEQKLNQAQKMEAVGRLAGGVAHDFNNLLTAIKGFTELLMLELEDDDSRRGFATEIQGAATRAAALTRQLLAFSRKQVLQPQVLDLNASMAEMERLLRRLIGEDIELVSRPAAGLGRVKADPGQVEQVIMNLVVNARDSMPEGGRLTLTTSNVVLTPEQIPGDAEVQPGPFVMLSVRDTGAGMDAETQARIFEPFFTTKEQGKGTGLGLSTVYGILQQSGGFIEVESAPAVGTEFRVFLPRVEETLATTAARPAALPLVGTETVLLVEDELAVRVLVRRVLDRAGYRILEADGPRSALELLDSIDAPIDVLLTDVVMPGMSGRELADRVVPRLPGVRVLFMSGYTDEAIAQHGVLEAGVALLEKPFTPEILLRKLRDVLDSPAPAA